METTTATAPTAVPPPREDPESEGEERLSFESQAKGNDCGGGGGDNAAAPSRRGRFGALRAATGATAAAFGQKICCRHDGSIVQCLDDVVLAVVWVAFLFLAVITSTRDGPIAISPQVVFGVFFLAKTVECLLKGKRTWLVSAGLFAVVMLQLSALTESMLPLLVGVVGPFAALILAAVLYAFCAPRLVTERRMRAADLDASPSPSLPSGASPAGRSAEEPEAEETPAEGAGPPRT